MALENSSPLVSFRRGEQVFSLGTRDEGILHLHGSQGLGLPPVDIQLVDRVGADGARVNGVRYKEREIFIPLLIHKRTLAECTQVRRELYSFLAPHRGPVEVVVEDPATGTVRRISGRYKGGLEGDFDSGFHGAWQTLGLKFVCPDPWWRGEQNLISLSVAPGVKPFLSETVPFFPVILSQSAVQDRFTVEIAGAGEVTPTWQVTGPGEDLMISNGAETFRVNHQLRAGETLAIDTARRRLTPDVWEKVPLSSRLFTLKPGVNHLHITMNGATPETRVNLVYAERFLEAI